MYQTELSQVSEDREFDASRYHKANPADTGDTDEAVETESERRNWNAKTALLKKMKPTGDLILDYLAILGIKLDCKYDLETGEGLNSLRSEVRVAVSTGDEGRVSRYLSNLLDVARVGSTISQLSGRCQAEFNLVLAEVLGKIFEAAAKADKKH